MCLLDEPLLAVHGLYTGPLLLGVAPVDVDDTVACGRVWLKVTRCVARHDYSRHRHVVGWLPALEAGCIGHAQTRRFAFTVDSCWARIRVGGTEVDSQGVGKTGHDEQCRSRRNGAPPSPPRGCRSYRHGGEGERYSLAGEVGELVE